MKKEWADKWVEALRSGEFKQGRDFLKTNDDKYCCLGVLCKIVAPDFNIEKQKYLNSQVVEIAGLSNRYGERKIEYLSLAMLNDQGREFTEIADIIEKEWESL